MRGGEKKRASGRKKGALSITAERRSWHRCTHGSGFGGLWGDEGVSLLWLLLKTNETTSLGERDGV